VGTQKKERATPQQLIVQYLKTKTPRLRDELVQECQPLVEYIAWKLAYNKSDLEDLVQVGTIGLLKSIDRFQVDKKVDFITFATPNIMGEIKHYFRDKSHLFKIPRRFQELRPKLNAFIQDYTQTHSKSPSIKIIAAHFELSEETVLETLEAVQTSQTVSLDEPSSNDHGHGMHTSLLLHTMIPASEDDQYMDSETVQQALNTLDSREKRMIHLRFYEGYTQTQIAEDLQLSQMHVSRLLAQALSKLKEVLAENA